MLQILWKFKPEFFVKWKAPTVSSMSQNHCLLIALALVMYDIRQKEEGVQSWKEHTGAFINPVVLRIAWLLLSWFAGLRQVQFSWGSADLQN